MPAITLIRHGQASFGKADYDQLSKIGFSQAQALGASLRARKAPIDAVWIGAMRRHRETAETCLEAAGIDLPLQVLPNFNEFNHEQIIERFEPRYVDRSVMVADLAASETPGLFFGQLFQAALERWSAGAHDADYDEPWTAFQQRSCDALDTAMSQLDSSQEALVFTSGGCISVISQRLLGLSNAMTFKINWSLANASMTRIASHQKQSSLISLNEHSHFIGQYRDLLTYK